MNEAAPPIAAFGSRVTLQVGDMAVYDDGLVVTLKAVNDSRCPQGVQCIWQGELAPALRLQGGSLDEETDLIFGTVRGLTGRAGDYAVELSGVTEDAVEAVVTKSATAAAGSATGMIRVSSPQAGQTVTSPLVVTGEARGNWYFEASFPAQLLDANGNLLTSAPARAQGDWMTEEFVPFQVSLAFDIPAGAAGTLVLKRDNPSGLPENDAEIRLPVEFAAPAGPQRAVKLYFFDYSKDRDAAGNILCSKQGLALVERNMPVTKTPIQDAVRLLLQGGLTDAERNSGIATEFPLLGVALKGASLNNGVLTLEFDDPNNRTGGGSCRVGILWSQIEATAKQFSEVKEVRFLPEELFQP